eukprot:3552819-Pyramimonas_sp.AAC.1
MFLDNYGITLSLRAHPSKARGGGLFCVEHVPATRYSVNRYADGRIHVGEHPASSRVVVGGGVSARQVLRMYGVPLGLVGAGVGGKLAYDYYQDYAERHRLLRPWRGDMIKIKGVNALQAPPTTIVGRIVEAAMIAGAFCAHSLQALARRTIMQSLLAFC